MASVPENKWSRHLDKKSKKYYFFNSATGETVWKRPKDFRPRGARPSTIPRASSTVGSSENPPGKNSIESRNSAALDADGSSSQRTTGLVKRGSKFQMSNPLNSRIPSDSADGSTLI